MNRRILLIVLVLAMLPLAAFAGKWMRNNYEPPVAALASPTTNVAAHSAWSAQERPPSYPAATFDVALAHKKHITLTQAIAVAIAASPGSAIDAFLADDGGKPAYDVRVLSTGDTIVTDSVDAASGKVTGNVAVLPAAKWTAFERQEVANARNSSVSLDGAITLAKDDKHARIAIAAATSDARNELGYSVDLVRGGLVDRMAVRPS
jgi:hypothetical protein